MRTATGCWEAMYSDPWEIRAVEDTTERPMAELGTKAEAEAANAAKITARKLLILVSFFVWISREVGWYVPLQVQLGVADAMV